VQNLLQNAYYKFGELAELRVDDIWQIACAGDHKGRPISPGRELTVTWRGVLGPPCNFRCPMLLYFSPRGVDAAPLLAGTLKYDSYAQKATILTPNIKKNFPRSHPTASRLYSLVAFSYSTSCFFLTTRILRWSHSNDIRKLLVPRTHYKLGDRSFSASAGPRLWNDLPPGLRRPGLSFDSFRPSLKTHLCD